MTILNDVLSVVVYDVLTLSTLVHSVKTQMAARHAEEEGINGEEPHVNGRSVDDEQPQALSEKEMEKKQAPRQG